MLVVTKFIIITVLVANVANAIINGDIVEISNYAYAASILSANVHRCGGTVIGEKYILTAASCVGEYNATNLTVRAGSSFYDKGGQLVDVENINVHPSYNDPKNLLNNIAILELSTSLVLGANVSVIPLDTTGSVNVTGEGAIVGWGIVVKEESGWVKPYKPSEQLRFTSQPIVGQWTCQDTFVEGWDQDTMFCAGLYSKDNCVGDIGNPFVFNGIQLGIASETLLMCGEFPTANIYTWCPNCLTLFIHEISSLLFGCPIKFDGDHWDLGNYKRYEEVKIVAKLRNLQLNQMPFRNQENSGYCP